MQRPEEVRAEAKLKVLIRHLVLIPRMVNGQSPRAAVQSVMATSIFQVRTYHRLPVLSPLYFHNEHIQGTGTLWNLSLNGCRMDTNVILKAGTPLEVMILLGANGALHVKAAIVSWARGLECGLRFVLVQPGEAARLERYITQRITEAASAQYPSH